jgi:hypothetical protein
MKKSLLYICLLAAAGAQLAFAQKTVNVPNSTQAAGDHDHATPGRNCGTPIPSAEWDAWFNAQVENYKQNMAMNKTTATTYTIPVIVHVIHSNENVGTGSNISQAQINSQITVLNNDFASNGLNNALCPAAFISAKSNTGISWCMVLTDQNGNTLAEPGIDRVPYTSISGLAAPGTGYTSSTVDNTIKPATIWDPTKYCNMWVCKLGGGLLGYATFPTGTGLTGIFGTGTSTSDGVVMGYNYFGNTGNVSAPYNKGRTATHELGHWLGLRHINGDSNCGNDYCNDTPVQDALHGGCISSSTPYHVDMCGPGTSPNGEMTMNYMDYTDDACMYMFTNDQATRMLTAMANGTYRSNLSTQSITLCNAQAAPTCDTISNYNASTNTATLLNSGGTGAWGWISGTNNYSDLAKADVYSGYTPGSYVTGAILYFGRGVNGGNNASIQVKVWDDDGTGGAPGTVLGSVSLPVSSIVTNGTGNSVTFTTSIPVTGPFYLGIDGFTYGSNQDSIALIHNANGETNPGTAWEQQSSGDWFNYSNASSWSTNMAHCVYPILCSQPIGTNFELLNNTADVVLYPNPANAVLYVNATFKKECNVTIRLTNALGQIVSSRQISNTAGGTFTFDTGSLAAGIYFVSVSSPEKTITKKLIIEK